MYKIVNLADLKLASVFTKSDKVIEINSNKTKMSIANNDHDHKSQEYLAKCIDIADKSMTSYLKAIDAIKTTYFTTDITNVYLKNGSAIKQQTFDTILSSNAFLTKEGCKKIETDCIAYINELKNKAVSLIMANLNASFIAQNSVAKLAYGQTVKQNDHQIEYVGGITVGTEEPTKYNFETGEFSLMSLLCDPVGSESSDPSVDLSFGNIDTDAWNDFFTGNQYLSDNESYSSIEDILEIVDPNGVVYAFNSNKDESNYKVNVPENSFDYKRNQTIPIAKLVEYFLKQQIKKCIITVCNRYTSQMASVPTMTKT